ncbi:hypothetical protein HAX54_024856, partial [Datura stramonium]|nr:hypothetical protein [Datura stramonium]
MGEVRSGVDDNLQVIELGWFPEQPIRQTVSRMKLIWSLAISCSSKNLQPKSLGITGATNSKIGLHYIESRPVGVKGSMASVGQQNITSQS